MATSYRRVFDRLFRSARKQRTEPPMDADAIELESLEPIARADHRRQRDWRGGTAVMRAGTTAKNHARVAALTPTETKGPHKKRKKLVKYITVGLSDCSVIHCLCGLPSFILVLAELSAIVKLSYLVPMAYLSNSPPVPHVVLPCIDITIRGRSCKIRKLAEYVGVQYTFVVPVNMVHGCRGAALRLLI